MGDAEASAAARELSRHRWRGSRVDRLVEELVERREELTEANVVRLTEAIIPERDR